jgi:hypothetical protein
MGTEVFGVVGELLLVELMLDESIFSFVILFHSPFRLLELIFSGRRFSFDERAMIMVLLELGRIYPTTYIISSIKMRIV